jgi:PilZ domain
VEFRTEPRLSTFEEARVTCGRGEWARSCVLADVSQTGACLRLVGAADLPAEIALYLPRSVQWTRARLVWRRATACGVEFLRPLMPMDKRG